MDPVFQGWRLGFCGKGILSTLMVHACYDIETYECRKCGHRCVTLVSNVIVERVNPERDAQNIAHLINWCADRKLTVLPHFTVEEEMSYLMNMPPREMVFVANVDGKFAGFAGIAPRFSYSPHLTHCAEGGTWVVQDFWGKGVSKMLWIEGCFPWGREVGFRHYSHFVPVHNLRAIRHYEKLGFRVCGYHRQLVEWADGTSEDAVIMEQWFTYHSYQ